MRKFLLLLFLLNLNLAISQEQVGKITITFDDIPLSKAITDLENASGYQFFFVDEWLENKRITGDFREASVDEILQEILNETPLNFYILDEKVILTRNNIIYDELPQGFFPQEREELAVEEEEIEDEQYSPVFYNIGETVNKTQLETVYIGKETGESRQSRFILTGYVRDVISGLPIPNLSVIVRGKGIGSVTDSRGFYRLSLPAGENIIETVSLGSKNVIQRVFMYNNGELNLDLEENFEQLGEVLLESNADENVNSAVAGAENIEIEEIKNIPLVLGERDILKVAATLPGISTAGEGAAGFNVRGGKTDQNLMLLDDAVIYNPAHFFGIFSAINPFTTGSVDIYKGSIPAEYGGRLSSVFDIKTKDANTEKFAGEVSVGPVTSNIALEIPIVKEKSGLLIGGRSTYSDWILKSLDEESLQNSQASFYDVIAKYHHQLSEKTNMKATGYFSSDSFSITSDSLFSYTNRLFSLNVGHNFDEKNRGNLILSNSDYKFNIDYESDFSNNFNSGYNINETEVKLNMNYRYSSAHNFEYGIASKLYMVNPGFISPTGSDSNILPLELNSEKGLESAVYIADSFKVSDDLLINAGLRYSVYAALGRKNQNVYDKDFPRSESSIVETLEFGNNEIIETYGGPEVRLSARYFLQPDLSAKLSYNNSFQYIHTLSNNTTVSPTDTYKLTDLNIKPQRASQYSLGFYKNLKDNIYEMSVEGYYKTSQNILDYKVGAQLFLNENIETEVLQGEGRAFGAEFLIKKTEGRLNGWLGYTYSRSLIKLDGDFREERVNNGEYFPSNYDKPHDVSLVANYKITKRFSFSGNFVYQTGRPVTVPVGKYSQDNSNFVVYSDRNEFRIPDYYRLDLSFNVEGNHKIKKFAHSFWSISVYNVLGRNNPYSVFFVTEDGDIQAYQSSIFSIPVPTITYNFKF